MSAQPCPGPSWAASLAFVTRRFSTLPDYFLELARRYGPVSRLHGMRADVYLFDESDAIEDLLVTKARSFIKGRGIQRLRRLIGNGLLTSEPPEHIANRRLVQPAFHRKRIEAYGAGMIAAAQRRLAAWNDGDEIEIEHESMRITLDIAAETLFGGADLSADTEGIGSALTAVMETFPASVAPFGEVLDVFPFLPITQKFRRARAQLDATVERLIAEHRRSRDDSGDVLSLLLAARDEDGSGLSDEQIRDEVMTILIAGHETTAVAISWTIYLLQRHPEDAARIVAQLDAVLGGRRPALDDAPALTLVRAAFSESMRLYPPAWLIGRVATEPVELGGYQLKKHDVALVCQYVTHRNPRYWPEPGSFSLERWLDGAKPPEKFAYFPFGGGNRICIGEGFAWLEGVLVLATLLQQARFELIDAAAVGLAPLVTLRPASPIRARVRVRSPHRAPASAAAPR